MQTQKQRILGCLIGGMVGDATGATLEFAKKFITDDDVSYALTVPGEGPFWIASGQITDDSELMLALLTALVRDGPTHSRPPSEFPTDLVAKRYIEWHRSTPFDMGMTCGRAFGFAQDHAEMLENAAKYNGLSEANGALMRCAPIAVWGVERGLSNECIADCARTDACLSHPNRACQDASALLCIVIAMILRTTTHVDILAQQTTEKAITGEKRLALSVLQKVRAIFETFYGDSVVTSWIRGGPESTEINAKVNAGHAKHAVQLVMRMLHRFALPGKNNYTFERAMRDVLIEGGDTDTNACICGYVAGCLCGLEGIPEHMRARVLDFDCTAVSPSGRKHIADAIGYSRPSVYKASNVIALCQEL